MRNVIWLMICIGCSGSAAVQGLAKANQTGGPRVLFDLTRKPLPEIPFPNDIATRVDLTSPTGLRINASQLAPTHLEESARGLLDSLDGFGTYAPITVAFDSDLDVLDFYARQNDSDPDNDGVYLVQLDTGETWPLDVNGGHFPMTLANGGSFFRNDPLSGTLQQFFNVAGPDANFLHPPDPNWNQPWPQQVDDMMSFYERETKTLILRPVIPLKQETKYAVLLTDKLKGTNGLPVVSPWESINHVLQNDELKPLMTHSPVSLDHVAVAWAFTTQSTTREVEAIREGLYGRGKFAELEARAPVDVVADQEADATDNVYVVPSAKLVEVLSDPNIGPVLLGSDPASIAATLESMKYVDYYISGHFTSTNFLNDPTLPPQDATFDIDMSTGRARTSPETIYFFASVPKQFAGRKQPFPVAMYGHGYTSMRLEGVLLAGGQAAKFGVAMFDIEAFGHGLEVDPITQALLVAVLKTHGLGAFAELALKGRARDLDGDGVIDSGGDFWTADTFHTRDVVRQSIIDWFNSVRVLKSWDGVRTMQMGAKTVVAGDFDGDGVPDLGGPAVWPADLPAAGVHKGDANPGTDTFVFGSSLGGILSSILPAVEPAIVAGTPVSGGSGLADVGARSTLGSVTKAVFLELLAPLLVNCNWSDSEQRCDGANAQPSLVFEVQRVNDDEIIPVAPVALKPGDTVTICNLAHDNDCRSSTADTSGNLRIPIDADQPLWNVVETPRAIGLANAVQSTQTKPGDLLRITVNGTQVIDTFQYDVTHMAVSYPKGSPLMALARGYGFTRNTPDFRRLWGLSQLILEPGDPVSYAPHYFNDLLPARAGNPANVIVVATDGDKIVPIETGLGTARAAGLVEMKAIDPDYGMTIDQVLIKSGAIEGLDGLNRFGHPGFGPLAALPGHLRCDSYVDRNGVTQSTNCAQGLDLDLTGFSCDAQGGNCTDDTGGPRLSPPLRQQVQRRTVNGVSALVSPYLDPHGRHAVQPPQPDRAFDMDQYMLNMIGNYFASRGKDIKMDGACQAKAAECPWILPPPAE